MSRVVDYDTPDQLIAWAEGRLGCTFRDDARPIGLRHGADIWAVTVFDTFTDRDVHMTVAALHDRPWLTRAYLRHVVAYPFITCGLPRLTCMIDEANARSIRFTEHCGAVLEGRKRRQSPGGRDCLVYGLLAEECRWLPKTISVGIAKPVA